MWLSKQYFKGYTPIIHILDFNQFIYSHKVTLPTFWIRQYPYNSLNFARHKKLADNFVYTISHDNFVYTISRDNFVYTICVVVKDKRMIILYAIISCDQPTCLRFISRMGDFTLPFTLYPFHLSLYISPTFLSLYHSLLSI